MQAHTVLMTAFSLRMSTTSNAVSQLHARTANGTWKQVLGGRDDGRLLLASRARRRDDAVEVTRDIEQTRFVPH